MPEVSGYRLGSELYACAVQVRAFRGLSKSKRGFQLSVGLWVQWVFGLFLNKCSFPQVPLCSSSQL